jgi:glyoxylase-like metal-dependent hydrolase (beta-lactamase superfamily II)
LIGVEQVAVIDPGPDEDEHIRALSAALEPVEDVRILLTHRHGDHAGGAVRLAQKTGAFVLGPPSCRPPAGSGISFEILREGDQVPTDLGPVTVLEIPGHTDDHLAFNWEEAGALFVGDLLLGRGNTTWIGEYLGCVEDYLESLEKVKAQRPSVVYPGHGPPITRPSSFVNRFRRHRLERLEEVQSVRLRRPEASAEELAVIIYGGEIPEKLAKAATASVEAALFHLDRRRD